MSVDILAQFLYRRSGANASSSRERQLADAIAEHPSEGDLELQNYDGENEAIFDMDDGRKAIIAGGKCKIFFQVQLQSSRSRQTSKKSSKTRQLHHSRIAQQAVSNSVARFSRLEAVPRRKICRSLAVKRYVFMLKNSILFLHAYSCCHHRFPPSSSSKLPRQRRDAHRRSRQVA